MRRNFKSLFVGILIGLFVSYMLFAAFYFKQNFDYLRENCDMTPGYNPELDKCKYGPNGPQIICGKIKNNKVFINNS